MFVRLALISALVFAASGAVPTPESHFGHRMGVDRVLLDWNKVVSYFHSLEKSSDRIRVAELGKTTEGRPFIAATIASPETLRSLDRYRTIQTKLADPRITTELEAEKLIAEGKTVVMITCSIHATEVASTSTAVEFAYRLLTEDRPKFRAILSNVIFLLVPSLNPDGVDIVTRWYRKTLGTPYEGTSPPELYHKYVGHDNNRDWYMFSQVETRHTVSQLHNVWHPQIVYDVHQQGPYASRIFVPPWLDPIDPNVDAIVTQQSNAIGAGMASDLTAAGKKGVAINAMYDFWTPARHYQAYHGGLRILTESASARLATPVNVRPDQIQGSALGYDPRQQSWNYLEPWLGGEWRVRDIVDYQSIAWESILYQAAIRRDDMLRNFYRIGQRAVSRTTPSAFVIPAVQRDPGSTMKLLETLSFGQVEIESARSSFEAGGHKYPRGSYVIRLQQPYGSFAKTLLERQQYPDLRLYPGGPPKRPYDVTAQTLPLLMGVQVDTIMSPIHASLEKANSFSIAHDGHRTGPGVLPASDIASWRAINRIWSKGGDVFRDRTTGDFFTAAGEGRVKIQRPRIGLYKSYVPSMDEGWTRWVLEQFGFSYRNVVNKDIQESPLSNRYDVVLFPDQQASQIASGHGPDSMPAEYTGGLGDKGAKAIRDFVSAGGTAIFLNHATAWALDHLEVPAKNVLRGVSNRDFYSPGSLLNVSLDSSHPLAYGLPRDLAIWSEGSPAWETTGDVRIVARYPQSQILASGWLLGEKHLAGRASLLDVPSGKGHVILFGMRPQYRAQSYQNFKLLFNALVYPR